MSIQTLSTEQWPSDTRIESPRGMPLPGLQRQGADMRVMLVDDNTLFLNMLEAEQLARKRGIEIVGLATNGDDGLRLVAELKPDVVIEDLSMPDMNGAGSGIQRLKNQARPPRVVVLSLYDDPEYREQALLVGVDAYIVKSAEMRI